VLRQTQTLQAKVEGQYSNAAERTTDALGNIALIQSFARIEAEVSQMRNIGIELLSAQMPVLSWWALASVLTRTSITLTMLAILIVGISLYIAGTTTVEAKSGYGLSADSELTILRALALAAGHPVELVPTLLGAHAVPPEFRDGGRREWVRILVEELIPKVAEARLARYCDVYVDEGAYTIEEAREILEAAAARGLGLRVHAEQLTRTGAAWLAASLGAASVAITPLSGPALYPPIFFGLTAGALSVSSIAVPSGSPAT